MRIAGWHIEGFGVFRDYRASDFPPGLVVIHGPNEAGKSTLLAFLRAVLFGFPDRRGAEAQYPPLRGGRHGGAVLIESCAGIYRVERTAGRRARLAIVRPDGSAGKQEDLDELLGHADRNLFRSVFAFGLRELTELQSLSSDEVRARIFSAGIAGAGRSARAVVEALESDAQPLLRPRGGRLRELVAEADHLQRQIAAARRKAAEYPAVVVREEELGREVERLRIEWAAAEAEKERVNGRRDVERLREAGAAGEAELGRIDERLSGPEPPRAASLAGEAAAIRQLRAWLSDMAEVQSRLEGAEALLGERRRALGDEPRISHTPPWVTRMVVVLASLVLVLAFWRGAAADPVGGVALGSIAVTTLIVLLVVYRARIRAADLLRPAREARQAAVAEVQQQVWATEERARTLRAMVARTAAPLGLGAQPTAGQLDALEAANERQQDARRAWDAASADRVRVTTQLERWRRAVAAVEKRLAAQPASRMGNRATGDRGSSGEGRAPDDLRADYEAAIRAHEMQSQRRRSLEEASDVASLEMALQATESEIAGVSERWVVNRLASAMIERTLGEFERTRQPAVLAEASRIFARVTGGRYDRIVADSVGQSLAVLDRDRARRTPSDLSRGTSEQLYLAVRLGLAREFARRSAALPLIVDDVLVNFDPERAARMAAELRTFAAGNQVLFFTCHTSTRDLLSRTSPGARVIELPGAPSG